MRTDIDGGNVIDWGKTSQDYAAHRPNYPDRFFALLQSFGVGLAGQRILDLGTGVGFLALRFAEQGAHVTGIDIADGQIEEASRQAAALKLHVDFRHAPAEDTGLPPSVFDIVTASQCFHYFDRARAIAEVKRLLIPDGLFVTSHFFWLPRQDAIARASEQLVLQHNPKWTSADLAGDVPLMPAWSVGGFRLHAMFVFDEQMPFTRESWRGRIRACRGIGATLPPEKVAAFDRAHDDMLNATAGEHFTVLHRIDAHILRPNR